MSIRSTAAKVRRFAKAQPKGGDKVSNGTALLPGIDGRSPVARRYRAISVAIMQDVGGIEHCSEAKQQLIRRFAAASVLAENMEADLANGEPISISDHAILSSTLVRLGNRIGIERTSRDVTPPSVASYLQHLRDRDAAEAAAQRRQEPDVEQRIDALCEQHADDTGILK